MSKQNEPAFPVSKKNSLIFRGMTMRQWYKGQAVMGLMNIPGAIGINLITIVEATAAIADALLAEDEEHGEATDVK